MGSLGHVAAAPSSDELDAAIPDSVRTSFDESIEQGDIHLYRATGDPCAVSDDPPRFPQWVHTVPQLGEKPAVPPNTPDLTRKRDKDVLQGLTYGKGEKILQLDEPTGGKSYSLVHNLHALFPEHMMAIPYFGDEPFRPQTSDLIPEDLHVAWRVVRAYADAGRETVMFFNGGPLAGASQPHLHMQFCPFQYDAPPAPEALARSLPESSSRPTSIEESAPRLPLPWTQFCVALPADRATVTADDLVGAYRQLLRTSRAYTAEIAADSRADSGSETGSGPGSRPDSKLEADSEATQARRANRRRLPPPGPKRDSYNLFLTASHMHLVPRTDRLVALERPSEPIAAPDDDDNEDSTGAGEARAGDDMLRMSLNGLVYLGYWHVASDEDRELVRKVGFGEVLTRAAYVNEEYCRPSHDA